MRETEDILLEATKALRAEHTFTKTFNISFLHRHELSTVLRGRGVLVTGYKPLGIHHSPGPGLALPWSRSINPSQ